MTDIRTAEILLAPATDELRFLPEGPYPTTDQEVISWVAIQHGKTNSFGSLNLLNMRTGANRTHVLPGRPGFAFACDDGQHFVVGCERSIGRFSIETGAFDSFCDGVDADVDNTIINDGMIWEDNLIFGTKDLEFATKKAGLYLWRGCDKTLIRLRDDQICSNGKAVRQTASGLELIDIDSPTRLIVGYSLDIGQAKLGPARVLIDLKDDPAVPDGMMLTPDGRGVIVAMFHPGVVGQGETRHYDIESGKLVTTWVTPGSAQNTCPMLVDDGNRVRLVITTALELMSAETRAINPNAGCLFVGETDFEQATPMPLFPAANG